MREKFGRTKISVDSQEDSLENKAAWREGAGDEQMKENFVI